MSKPSGKSNISRLLKRVKKQEIKKMNVHLEKLGAAFTRETGLRASETALVQRTVESGLMEYTFTKRTFNPADTSPEVQEMFKLCMELSRATTDEEKDEGIKLVKEYVAQFNSEDESATDK